MAVGSGARERAFEFPILLPSVLQYPALAHEWAMAWGDAFMLDEVGAFQLVYFAQRCGIDNDLLKREAARLAKLALQHAPTQALF